MLIKTGKVGSQSIIKNHRFFINNGDLALRVAVRASENIGDVFWIGHKPGTERPDVVAVSAVTVIIRA